MRFDSMMLAVAITLGTVLGPAIGWCSLEVSRVNEKAPEYLGLLVETADKVTITVGFGPTAHVVTVEDKDWFVRLATLFRLTRYIETQGPRCISNVGVSVSCGGKQILGFRSICEGVLRVTTAEVSGEFAIDRETDAELWRAVREKIPSRWGTSPTGPAPEVQPVAPEKLRPKLPGAK